jgi:hypothetical protein
MSTPAEIEAALGWADRIESGEAATYDPYIVALARVVRGQREQLARYEAAFDGGFEQPVNWEEILARLHEARHRLDDLTTGVATLDPLTLVGAGHLTLDGIEYRVIEQSEVRELERAISLILEIVARAERS